MKYYFLANLFLQFLYYRRRNKPHGEIVVSMLSCDALEKSNNPYVESIVEPCVSKNQKAIFAMWIWLERKSGKRAEAMEKIMPELKAEFVVCVWERNKIKSFEVHVIILRCIRNVNLPIKKDFKFAELLTKTSFFLYFRDRPKNGEGNKLRRRRKYIRKSS